MTDLKQKSQYLPQGTKNLLILLGLYMLSAFVVPYNGNSTNPFYILYAVTVILLLTSLSVFLFLKFIFQKEIPFAKVLIGFSIMSGVSFIFILLNLITIGVLITFAASLAYLVLVLIDLFVNLLP